MCVYNEQYVLLKKDNNAYELFPNYIPTRPPLPRKVGVMTPQLLWERRPDDGPAFRVLNGLAPPYLDQLVRVADLPGRRTRSYTFINVTPAGHPCTPAGIHRPSVVSGRRINSVEHSAI